MNATLYLVIGIDPEQGAEAVLATGHDLRSGQDALFETRERYRDAVAHCPISSFEDAIAHFRSLRLLEVAVKLPRSAVSAPDTIADAPAPMIGDNASCI